jgi:hypothetical protein
MSENAIRMKLSLSGLSQVENGLRALRGGFSSIHGALARVGVSLTSALSVGAFANLTKQAINTADSMGKLAQKTGTAVQDLSALTHSSRLADVQLETLQRGLKELGDNMVKAGRGGESVVEEVIRLADEFKNMADDQDKVNRAMELFGSKSGPELIPLLNAGSDAIRAQVEEARRLGLIVGPEFAGQAEKFNDNLTRMKGVSEGLFLRLAERILPTLNEQLEKLLRLLTDLETSSRAVTTLTWIFERLGDTLTNCRVTLQTMWELGEKIANGSWIEKIKAFIQLTNPLLLLQAAGEKLAAEQFADAIAKSFGEALKPLGEYIKLTGEATQSTERLGREKLAAERKKIDLAIAENQLITERMKLEAADGIMTSEQVERLRNQLVITEQLIQKKRDLTSQAAFQDKTISPEDAREFEIADKGQLQGVAAGRRDLQDPNSMLEQTRAAMKALRIEFGTLAQQIARGFSAVIKSAVDGVASSITGLLTLTMTWGDALRNIASSVINGVINAIARMFAEWIIGRLAVKAVEIASAAAEGAAKLFPALMDSISSYGVAAAVGAAALGVAIAGMSGAFKDGGYTGDGGTSDVAGVVHKREFVMPADATARIGIGNLEAMRRGEGPAVEALSSKKINVAFMWSEADLRNRVWNSREADEWFVHKMERYSRA